jgi:acylphosphatase
LFRVFSRSAPRGIAYAKPGKIPGVNRKASRFYVAGRVQGVGYRFFACREAAALGLHGWVRNLPDGRVEAYAIGTPAALDAFEQRLRKGPPAGYVSHVETAAAPLDAKLEGFHIR